MNSDLWRHLFNIIQIVQILLWLLILIGRMWDLEKRIEHLEGKGK